MLLRHIFSASFLFCLSSIAQSTESCDVAPPPPTIGWDVGLESGALFGLTGNASDIAYKMIPMHLTFTSPPVLQWRLWDGDLVVRNRLYLIGDTIIDGPESYFVGFSAGPELEYWRTPHWAFYIGAGGGVGLMDSQGYNVPGGQGQDFNFTYYFHGGVKYALDSNWTFSLGIRFQHISNTGLDDVNPGIDAIGPVFGIQRKF